MTRKIHVLSLIRSLMRLAIARITEVAPYNTQLDTGTEIITVLRISYSRTPR